MHKKILLTVIVCCCFTRAYMQDSINSKVSDKYIRAATAKSARLEKAITGNTEKVLQKMQTQEQKLNKKLARIDSLAANRLFSGSERKYTELRQKLAANSSIASHAGLNYIPGLDSLKTSLQFLKNNADKMSGNISGMQDKLDNTIGKVNGLTTKLDQAQAIRQFLKERRQYLKEQLSKFGLGKQLKKMNKQVYYYSQALQEYKNILNDPKKIERKALAMLTGIPAFKKFMQTNSQFASLFGIPSGASANGPVSFAGLQTRASVQQAIQNSVAISGAGPGQFLGQQLQSANQQVSSQKNSIRFPELRENMGEMPDFKPNQQKTKSFFKRLEYGGNVQFGKTNRFLPATSDIAVSIGYKLNDNGIVGIGSSYKLGLGTAINHIRFSHQGFGLRSYIDWKIKGNFYMAGGYEKNYLQQLNDLSQTIPAWQESGLIGISKKYPVSRKRKGYVQLLFDFLSYKNIPRSQPVLFRTGINF